MSTVTALRATAEQPRRLSFAQQVAANVRAEAARRELRQVDLADAIGLTQPRVSSRWRGTHPWSLEELEAIAPLLGTTASKLCAIRDSNPEPAD